MKPTLTKIICTIGPATEKYETIIRLIKAGMRIARLNASHGDHLTHKSVIRQIRKASQKLDIPIAVMLDLQGPKIRLGRFPDGPVHLASNSIYRLTSRNVEGSGHIASVSYKNLINEAKVGHRILIDDGLVQLKVIKKVPQELMCRVQIPGTVSSHKGINLPDTKVGVSFLTAKDREDLLFGVKMAVDYVALSFVRSAQDILSLKRLLKMQKADIPVIAKLEKPEAVDHLADIIKAADGVMIARGDLGVEMPLEELPPLQKKIINLGLQYQRPVITATQMLESMRENPRPTRAEVTDVANAIFDGTDAVMLSAETATGNYPVETVRMMTRIVREAESSADTYRVERRFARDKSNTVADAVCRMAGLASGVMNAKAIAVFTQSGFSAALISHYRPTIPILAFTPNEEVRRKLTLYRGVQAYSMDVEERMHLLSSKLDKFILKHRLLKKGDVLTLLAGTPLRKRGITNLIKLHIVGESLK